MSNKTRSSAYRIQKVYESIELKKKSKEKLNNEEKLLKSGSWFFSLPLPLDVIYWIKNTAELYDCKPYQIVEAFIMKEYNKALNDE